MVEEAKKENPTLIMLERLQSPVIQEQILAIVKKYSTSLCKSPEEVMDEMNNQIELERTRTYISRKKTEGGSYFNRLTRKAVIGVRRSFFKNKERDQLDKGIVEAHEKEHAVRSHLIPLFRGVERRIDKVAKGTLSKSSYYLWKSLNLSIAWNIFSLGLLTGIPPIVSILQSLPFLLSSPYLHSGMEVYARMSQLKNYFGFRGGEKFTKDHLYYAKENYVKDTGTDNNMTSFLKAITPKTEDKFIEMINTFGV